MASALMVESRHPKGKVHLNRNASVWF